MRFRGGPPAAATSLVNERFHDAADYAPHIPGGMFLLWGTVVLPTPAFSSPHYWAAMAVSGAARDGRQLHHEKKKKNQSPMLVLESACTNIASAAVR